MLERFTVADLTPALLETGSIEIKPQKKKLASGRESYLYLNVGDRVISHARAKDVIIDAFTQMFEENTIQADRLLGVPEGMNALTSSLTDRLRIGQLRVREKIADHGEQKSIEGNYIPGQEVTIFEDVMSTGKSTIRRAIEPIQAVGLKPTGVVTLIDREYGGVQVIRDQLHVPTFAFTTTSEIADELIRTSALSDKELRLLGEEMQEITAFKPSTEKPSNPLYP